MSPLVLESLLDYVSVKGLSPYVNMGFSWTGTTIPLIAVDWNEMNISTFDFISDGAMWCDIQKNILSRKCIADSISCVFLAKPDLYIERVCKQSGIGILYIDRLDVFEHCPPSRNTNIIVESKAEALRRLSNMGKAGFVQHEPCQFSDVVARFSDVTGNRKTSAFDLYYEIPHTYASPESMASSIARQKYFMSGSNNALHTHFNGICFHCDIT